MQKIVRLTADPATLDAALELAQPLVTQLHMLLLPELPILDDEARAALPRPLADFEKVAPLLVEAMGARPKLATAADFDGARVTRQLAVSEKIDRARLWIRELDQLLGDAQLAVRAEAWEASLAAYGMAQFGGRKDPTLRTVLEPMAELFKKRSRGGETVIQAAPQITTTGE